MSRVAPYDSGQARATPPAFSTSYLSRFRAALHAQPAARPGQDPATRTIAACFFVLKLSAAGVASKCDTAEHTPITAFQH